MENQHIFNINSTTKIGASYPLFICGPCVVESESIIFETAEYLKTLFEKYKLPFVFKSSFDKANRTSGRSFRSIGFEDSLKILSKVGKDLNLPVLTDVHETSQVGEVSDVVDILQIPAFLCRQTDLIQAVARTGKVVNIKKGQFMAPDDMFFAVQKSFDAKNERVILTERGSSFGYHNLVVDMRSFVIMRTMAPVVFDLTHSVQQPGGLGGKSGGQRQYAPYLARAAAASGVDGFFMETHPNPDSALSDGPNMIPLTEMEKLINELLVVWNTAKPFWKD
ncbi:MAG: 3-deoxy-8-phosphooctulonate synthase [Anaerolineaceae bacterium]|nr:3-deoxy-8-phosphooctulonate synthase [Anaerolineaceae bacterium]